MTKDEIRNIVDYFQVKGSEIQELVPDLARAAWEIAYQLACLNENVAAGNRADLEWRKETRDLNEGTQLTIQQMARSVSAVAGRVAEPPPLDPEEQ